MNPLITRHLPKFNALVMLFVVTLFTGGCATSNSAVNRTENYAYAWPAINYKTADKVIIGVIDQRPNVINGNVKPSFVGLMRGGFGNPFHMHTQSGNPLADDIVLAVVSGFKNSGIDAKSELLKFNMQSANSHMASLGAAKKILVTINEWKSDTYTRTNFFYDLDIEVYDKAGVRVAKHPHKNTDLKGENLTAVSPLAAARDALTKLLNNQEIIKAIQAE